MKTKINLTQEQLTAWIAALRSGKYKKGAYRLYDRRTDRYCCLGVLCVVNEIPSKTFEDKTLFQRDATSDIKDGASAFYPNPLVCEDDDGSVYNPKVDTENFEWLRKKYRLPNGVISLSILNDSYCVSFGDMAVVIEESFEPAL